MLRWLRGVCFLLKASLKHLHQNASDSVTKLRLRWICGSLTAWSPEALRRRRRWRSWGVSAVQVRTSPDSWTFYSSLTCENPQILESRTSCSTQWIPEVGFFFSWFCRFLIKTKKMKMFFCFLSHCGWRWMFITEGRELSVLSHSAVHSCRFGCRDKNYSWTTAPLWGIFV